MNQDKFVPSNLHYAPSDLTARAIIAAHIGANGRWFVICMVIIAIAAGNLFQATVFAICLGLIHIVEGILQPGQERNVAAVIVYGVLIGNAILLLFAVRPA